MKSKWNKTCHLSARQRVLGALGALALVLTFGAGRSLAEDSSSKIARIIVPFAPGAAVDVVARMLAGPVRMSMEIIGRVNDAVSRALNTPEIRKQIEARDIVVTDMGPNSFAEEIKRLSRLNAEAVQISGAKPE